MLRIVRQIAEAEVVAAEQLAAALRSIVLMFTEQT
jgi:hypothetical protein